jgi:gamma-D-glutamyl-L-lysine dipeptidyl-peptidase
MYAICQISISSVYKAANERSELLTQVLFGEVVEVLERKGELVQVRCTWDDVTGWALADQFSPVVTDAAIDLLRSPSTVLSLVDNIMAADHFIPVTMGASLPNFDGVRGNLADLQFQFNGSVIKAGSFELKLQWIEKLVLRFMHAPELYGGRSPFGIDDAAMVQLLYKMLGISLARYTPQQVAQGRTVDFMEFCQPGDLAYFDDGRGNISHVGVILSDCSLIHVAGRVRRDKVDHFGVWNSDLKQYTWQLRVVKRHLPDFPADTMLTRMLQKAEAKAIETDTNAAHTSLFDL